MTGSTKQISLLRDLLMAGRMPLTAAQGNADDAARKSHIEAVRFLVHVQREDSLVILAVRQAPGNGSGKPDRRFSRTSGYRVSLCRFNHSLRISQLNRILTSDAHVFTSTREE